MELDAASSMFPGCHHRIPSQQSEEQLNHMATASMLASHQPCTHAPTRQTRLSDDDVPCSLLNCLYSLLISAASRFGAFSSSYRSSMTLVAAGSMASQLMRYITSETPAQQTTHSTTSTKHASKLIRTHALTRTRTHAHAHAHAQACTHACARARARARTCTSIGMLQYILLFDTKQSLNEARCACAQQQLSSVGH